MDQEELNLKYKPSAWNPNLSPNEVIGRYLRIAEECKFESRQSTHHQLNISYGERTAMAFDLYGTDLPTGAPVFAFIHGGYWQMTSKDDNTFMVKPLVDAGCRVYIIGYDLCPSVTLEELNDEIQVALTKILITAKENNCPAVILGGHSAGACCAISMMDKSRLYQLPNRDLLKALYLLGGTFDLSESRFTEEVNQDNLLSITDENVARLSPLLNDYGHLKEMDTKICIITAQFDAPGLIKQGQMMFAKLTAEGANTEMLEAEKLDHFDLMIELCEKESFLTKHLVNYCLSFGGN